MSTSRAQILVSKYHSSLKKKNRFFFFGKIHFKAEAEKVLYEYEILYTMNSSTLTPDLAKMGSIKGRTQRLEPGATETKGKKSASQKIGIDLKSCVFPIFPSPKWEGLLSCFFSIY